jgi:8-oxo-dGTP pyrophosphatase MutT (NUDIX family)
MSIRRVSTATVYENPWMRVREDRIERADGSQGIYGVVEKPDFALVIPQERDGSLWLVEQYRYPVAGRYWEFPQGSWEHAEQVDAADLARGELAEETGLGAGSMRHLGHLYEAYGYSTQGFDVWLATDLVQGDARRESTEQDMRARQVPRAEWEAMVRDGVVKDAPSLAAYGLLLTCESSSSSCPWA